jgi:hypothetical protein
MVQHYLHIAKVLRLVRADLTWSESRHTVYTQKRLAIPAFLFLVCSALAIVEGKGGNAADTPKEVAKNGDGRHDFDWDIGTWKTYQKRLLHPLTGSTTWVEYQGTDVVHKIWDGANIGEIRAEGPTGHLELFGLRLYNPDTREWSIYFSNSGGGVLSAPVIGSFKGGHAEFIDQESYNGRTILVRFSILDITPDSCRFEQAFSSDGGRTWETNFVVTETRMKGEGADKPGGTSASSLRRGRLWMWGLRN